MPIPPESRVDKVGGSTFRSDVTDPTTLTTQALLREISNLKELMETRLNAMDKAMVLLQDFANRSPTISVIEERVTSIAKVVEEKFGSIQMQFKERDTRTDQTSRDAKTAVDAALQAAKEAVSESNKSAALAIAKSEMSTIKSIDQIASLIQNIVKASDDKFSDLKDRMTTIEGRGGSGAGNGQGAMVAYLLAALGLVGTLIGIFYAINLNHK